MVNIKRETLGRCQGASETPNAEILHRDGGRAPKSSFTYLITSPQIILPASLHMYLNATSSYSCIWCISSRSPRRAQTEPIVAFSDKALWAVLRFIPSRLAHPCPRIALTGKTHKTPYSEGLSLFCSLYL